MNIPSSFLERQEIDFEGRRIFVQLFPLKQGETIEGKKEVLVLQGLIPADLSVIRDFLDQNPGIARDIVIADSTAEPIRIGCEGSLLLVPAHGICERRHNRNGLIDYRIPAHFNDVICILGIIPSSS